MKPTSQNNIFINLRKIKKSKWIHAHILSGLLYVILLIFILSTIITHKLKMRWFFKYSLLSTYIIFHNDKIHIVLVREMRSKELLRNFIFLLPVGQSCYSLTSILARSSHFLLNFDSQSSHEHRMEYLQKTFRHSS